MEQKPLKEINVSEGIYVGNLPGYIPAPGPACQAAIEDLSGRSKATSAKDRSSTDGSPSAANRPGLDKSSSHEDLLTFFLLADSHVCAGGTWPDTLSSLKAGVGAFPEARGILHLGDLTDGNVPRQRTEFYARHYLADLRSLGLPLYFLPGNHDTNYFRNNPQPFTRKQVEDIYLTQAPDNVVRSPGKFYFKAEFTDKNVTFFFLDAFDYREKYRYGYTEEEILWLEEELNHLPVSTYALVLSHVPLLPRMHHWSKDIRCWRHLLAVLQRFQLRSGGRLLGFIHGHNHGDQVDLQEGFPIVSIACDKIEECPDIKPEGCLTPARSLGDVSAQLWDLFRVDTAGQRLYFYRYGAGEDRIVDCRTCYEKWKEDKMAFF